MSTSIDLAFIKNYVSDVHDVFQRRGSFLLPAVRHKPDTVGTTTTFQKIGTGIATTKARHGTITPMNQAHTPVTCTLADFYAGDWVDKLDEAKTNADERRSIASGGAWALGRKVDEQILTILDGTTQSTVSWTLTSSATVRNALLGMVEALDGNDVPNDGLRYALLTPRAYAMAMTVREFSSSDYVGANGSSPFEDGMQSAGKWKSWMNVMWGVHTGLPGKGTASAKVFAWHKRAVGYASAKAVGNLADGKAVKADITWHGDRAAHFVNHTMSGGACLIDDLGVIEGNLDDTASIPTS